MVIQRDICWYLPPCRRCHNCSFSCHQLCISEDTPLPDNFAEQGLLAVGGTPTGHFIFPVRSFSVVRFGNATASPGYFSPGIQGASWKSRSAATSNTELRSLSRDIHNMVYLAILKVQENSQIAFLVFNNAEGTYENHE